MKWKRSWFGVLLVNCVILFFACNTRKDEDRNTNGSDTLRHVTVDSIDLFWSVDSIDLAVKISAPTTGWVAAGFDPTMGMQDANIIIGFVRNDSLFIRDDYGSSLNTHDPDTIAGGTHNIVPDSSSELNNRTMIGFRIPLNSGDIRDRHLTAGSTYNVLLAYGDDGADDFDIYHKHRVLVSIRL